MSEDLAVRKISPPEGLDILMRDPPLVGDERREDYDKFFAAFVNAAQPKDAIEWCLLKDLVDLEWEIQRERRVKADIINLEQARLMSLPRNSILNQQPAKFAQLTGKDASSGRMVLARAFIAADDNIDAVDRRLALYEARRNAVHREMMLRAEFMARRLKSANLPVLESNSMTLAPQE